MSRKNIFHTAELIIALIVAFQLGIPTIARAASIGNIDTTPSWNGTTFISSFGSPNTATYGQTIMAPEGTNSLTSFSFFLLGPTTMVFRGFVADWDSVNKKVLGTPLYESAPRGVSQSANYEEVVFNIPGGLALKAGQTYVLFASISKDPGQPNSAGKWGSVGNNTAYPDGQFVFMNNTNDTTMWTSTAWSTISQDLAFKANFTWHYFMPMITH